MRRRGLELSHARWCNVVRGVGAWLTPQPAAADRRQDLKGLKEDASVTYRLTALVGDRRVLAEVAAELQAARVVELAAGMSLLPLTKPVLDQVPTGPPGDDGDRPLRGFEWLTPGLAGLAARCSRVGPLLYAEARNYGGPGWQAVIAWRDGQVSFGPVLTQDAVEGREAEGFVTVGALRDWAINRGLRHLGVQVSPDSLDEYVDEFDLVGLGPPRGRRVTEDWA
jgi:hypothetical protein